MKKLLATTAVMLALSLPAIAQDYTPDPAAKPKSLPCIVTAPAGSNLLFGMALGDGDRAGADGHALLLSGRGR